MSSFIIITSIVAFTLVILLLVFILLFAQSKLVQSGDVKITINGDTANPITASAGSTLLSTLGGQKIFLPSACGGGGSCAMCNCNVIDGGVDVLPNEVDQLTRSLQKEKVKLSCQVQVNEHRILEFQDYLFAIKQWECS